MSTNHQKATAVKTPFNFRRYKDGDNKVKSFQKDIFDAGHSHKCPTYIQSTPPCQGSCPAGEDIRGYLNIVRGIEKPPHRYALAGVRVSPPDRGQPVPLGHGPGLSSAV
jgi:hypothetical protein